MRHTTPIAALDHRLAATDRLIDRVVYALCGLSDEEITIVEGQRSGVDAVGQRERCNVVSLQCGALHRTFWLPPHDYPGVAFGCVCYKPPQYIGLSG